eukprot:GHVT01044325.1.p1 GENE.GHVT01044325.1~~GHVT01044325.1.p1  ORF type:complete len:384 (-),score=82.57 GHVT01044325.1:1071-2222(-)
MKEVFDFQALKALVARPDFSLVFDGLNGVAGPYAHRVFVENLGAPASCLVGCEPKEDFGGCHPDPNLTYAKQLVATMKPTRPEDCDSSTPVFGAAGDGDADRNMILGRGFFVTPSDSVAIIAAYASQCIPYFQKEGVKGLARSMPTSAALDLVANQQGVPIYEVPTGWKFFGNLMDAGQLSICGEESFGTGSNHIREKDGMWAVLAWLSILAHRNQTATETLVDVAQIVKEHWTKFGRNYYSRYDYEGVSAEQGGALMDRLRGLGEDLPGLATKFEGEVRTLLETSVKVSKVDEFTYTDPVDGSVSSKQGLRYFLEDGSRLIWRISGTSSAGATVRMYVEKYEKDEGRTNLATPEALKDLIEVALALSNVKAITGRDAPTVIT